VRFDVVMKGVVVRGEQSEYGRDRVVHSEPFRSPPAGRWCWRFTWGQRPNWQIKCNEEV